MEKVQTTQTTQGEFGAEAGGQQKTANPLNIERNSIVLQDWFERAEWPAKLAACLLHSLLTSNSDRLSEIGRNILKRLQKDIIQTDGMPAEEDMFVREIELILQG